MIRVQETDIHLIDLRTRLPFKYGIATMTEAPHAFIRVRAEVDGQSVTGIAADHLPPKWFTKVPEKPLDEETGEMLAVIKHAASTAIAMQGETAYDVWRQLYDAQASWGGGEQIPPLLSNFGTALVERALIEAVAKRLGEPFGEVLRANRLGIRLDEFDARLAGMEPKDLLPAVPCGKVIARQTVGMADPLLAIETPEDERLDDGLPQALIELIERYGLRHFKLKLSGNLEQDAARMKRIAGLLADHAAADYAFTMDGNEQFRGLDEFRAYWEALRGAPSLARFFEHLMFVEQPFHRDVALDAALLAALPDWKERPRLIMDESDAELDSLQRALALGYHGTSHKNCKGVFRGVAHACLLEKLRLCDPGSSYIMSSEDLANIGPVALGQDLAVAASLGIRSVERNGHHYFAGLSAFPESVWEQVLDAHGDLYHRTAAGWPAPHIANGELALDTVLAAPLGVGFDLDVELFTPVSQWERERQHA